MKNRNNIFAGIRFTLALLCAAAAPNAFGVVPPPGGSYPGFNTAEGQSALFSLTTGIANTAVGWFSLKSTTEGNFNTGVGAGTLLLNTGRENTAVGAGALLNNTTGTLNTAHGSFALFSNTEGSQNTAIGDGALFHNTVGGFNTVVGAGALYANTEGVQNMAIGDGALFYNTTGFNNTANGVSALTHNTEGSRNTAIGNGALFNNTTGDGNIAVGKFAGYSVTTADNVICIGHDGANVSDTTWIKNIYGTTTISATTLPVLVSQDGQLGTASSSRRFKKEIKPMDQSSEGILGLKPVTFHYKSDKTSTPQFGLIAEEVAEVNPDLVVRDDKGDIYTVRYDAVNAMLLNEFLKEHRRVQELEATVARQQKDFQFKLGEQEKQIEALASGLQRVSAQVEVTRPQPTLVLNH
jgi:hypothetical protein